jgi:hypothetical protein
MFRCAWGRRWANIVTSASAALMSWKDFSMGGRQAIRSAPFGPPLRLSVSGLRMQLFHSGWSGELGGGLHVVWERRHAGGGHPMPQKVNRLDTKNTFLQINH